jgi:serine/threonine protein kinase
MMAERIVGSAYRVGKLIARGGMGDVHEAIGPSGEPAAVKFLRTSGANAEDLATRFRREARIASRIVSPNVARVLGAGKDRDGSLWIAFERLQGEPMDETLHRERILPWADVAWIIDDVFEGLAAAHALGVVHRDIKPANVFLDRSVPRAKILDFGVSKLRDQAIETENPGLTMTDEALGTPGYMAPEQITAAANVDARADLYSAGLVAFVALAGAAPFHGKSLSSIQHHKRHLEPLTLAQVTGRSWPKELDEFMTRILARNPAHRYSSAVEALAGWRRTSRR